MGYYAQLAQCEGKIPFDSWGLAEKVAKRRHHNGKKGRPYRCPHCHKFHIGSTVRKSRRYQ